MNQQSDREKIIVSMTTYSKRIENLPRVLDTIYAQTLPPDLVVVNLAIEEVIPEEVQLYLNTHHVEINRVPDTKVYKKLIPTMKKYPGDCIITIDDDFLYPRDMIADFMSVHHQYPDFPISGNKTVLWGLQCHCGCASLTKSIYLGDYIDCIDDAVMKNCLSDDLVYSYFSNRNGHPYIRTHEMYFTNMPSYNEGVGYTAVTNAGQGIYDSYKYLVGRFGEIDNCINHYVKDEYLNGLMDSIVKSYRRMGHQEGREYVYSSLSYRLGECILKPLRRIRTLWAGKK